MNIVATNASYVNVEGLKAGQNSLKRGEAVEKLVFRLIADTAKTLKLSKKLKAGRCKGQKSRSEPFFRQDCKKIKELREAYKVYQEYLTDLEAFPTLESQLEIFGEALENPLEAKTIGHFERLEKRFGSNWFYHLFAIVQTDGYVQMDSKVFWTQVKERSAGERNIFQTWETIMVGEWDEWDLALRPCKLLFIVDKFSGEIRWTLSDKANRSNWLLVPAKGNWDKHYQVPTENFKTLSEFFKTFLPDA